MICSAYIAASRRSDRSIEARLESARRASEIHKRRCGRGLKVTEEAVMNEEMYEEEDPDYEQRVSRLRMVMNTPNYPYAAYSPMQQYYPVNMPMPPTNNNQDGINQDVTPGTPGLPSTTMDQQHPQHQFLFSPWYNQQAKSVSQSPLSPVSPGAINNGQYGQQMTHSMNNFVSPQPQQQQHLQQQHSPHFLAPTQFPQQQERTVPKDPYPISNESLNAEIVYDVAPIDVFGDIDFDADPTFSMAPPNNYTDFSNEQHNDFMNEQQNWGN